MQQCLSSAPDESYADYVDRHYPMIVAVLKRVARQFRLSADETDELCSRLHVRLVQDNYALLRQFRGQCSLASYLAKVVKRLLLDERTSRWGRWRPSREAFRLGPTARLLEQLLSRDRLPFDAACELLQTSAQVPETRDELEAILAKLPARRPRRTLVSLDDEMHRSLAAAAPIEAAAPARDHATLGALARVFRRLPADDRRLIGLRFHDRWTVARIAREHQLDQRHLYGRFEAILHSMRVMIAQDLAECDEPGDRLHRPCA